VKVGDVVRFKDSSVRATVSAINGFMVECTWFDEKVHLRRKWVNIKKLEPA
jgi:uncharacterized protein YodC (DUF2158 family)